MTPKDRDPRKEWFWRIGAGILTGLGVLIVTSFVTDARLARAKEREYETRTVAREEAVAVTTAAVGELKVSLEGLGQRLDAVAADVRELRGAQLRAR